MFEMSNSNYIFPTKSGFAALAIDISDGVQSREQDTLLGWTATHIHPTGRENDLKKQSQKHDNLNLSLASRLDWIANWIGDLHGIEEIGSSLTALERLNSIQGIHNNKNPQNG